jgi:hypothetical protein
MLIAGELAERGNLTDALKSVSRISEAQTRAADFQRSRTVEGRSGITVAAIATISMIPDPAGRVAALAALSLAQAEKGEAAAGNTVHLAWEAVGKSTSRVRGSNAFHRAGPKSRAQGLTKSHCMTAAASAGFAPKARAAPDRTLEIRLVEFANCR